MDQLEVVQLARQFVNKAGVLDFPVNVNAYASRINAKVRHERLSQGESGYTIKKPDGSHVITVNANENEERQRFTVCHEIGHVVLELPSAHVEQPIWAYRSRDKNEILCDIFAEEILMPYAIWNRHVTDVEVSLDRIERLRSKICVSYPAFCSRLATLAKFPCAFVTTSNGLVRHIARSTILRTAQAWVRPNTKISKGTIAFQLRENNISGVQEGEIRQDIWFDNWRSEDYLRELARNNVRYDATTSLLWFDEDELDIPDRDRFGKMVEDDGGLKELTGELPWPGRRKRRP